jgi:uncharacterized membrane protein
MILKDRKHKELRHYINTTLIGGFLVILPFAILLVVFKWIFTFILNIIAPITQLMTFGGAVNSFLASIMALVIIILICFGFGVLGRTTIGNYIFEEFEKKILLRIPFYKVINETVKQISNRDKMPFSKVVLVDVFSNDTRMTGFITDEHENGYFTVFVPTGPNPTNGFIFHVMGHQLQEIDIPVEEAIKSVIGVGTGSTNLFKDNRA